MVLCAVLKVRAICGDGVFRDRMVRGLIDRLRTYQNLSQVVVRDISQLGAVELGDDELRSSFVSLFFFGHLLTRIFEIIDPVSGNNCGFNEREAYRARRLVFGHWTIEDRVPNKAMGYKGRLQ